MFFTKQFKFSVIIIERCLPVSSFQTQFHRPTQDIGSYSVCQYICPCIPRQEVLSVFCTTPSTLERMATLQCNTKYVLCSSSRIPSKGLRKRLGLDDIISVLQQNRLRWYGHVLWKEDNDWVKKCMEQNSLKRGLRSSPHLDPDLGWP